MSHANALIKTSKSKRSWQFVSFILAGISVILTFSLIKVSGNTKVVLIPYTALNENAPISVKGEIGLDSTYLSLLADGDISLFLNWTPKTIDARLSQLKNRLTTEAYANHVEELTKDAAYYKQQGITQTFFPVKKEYKAPNQIIITGHVNRSVGARIMTPVQTTYILSYKQTGSGLYALSSIEIEKKE